MLTEAILREVREVGTDLGRLQNGLSLQRTRKARWVRQDRRIHSWLQKLEDGRMTMLEFLLAAHNVTKTLEVRQMDPQPEDTSDPALLAPVADLPEPGNFISLKNHTVL